MATVRKRAEAAGARVALSKHWEMGGEGAIELAETVVDACEHEPQLEFLYKDDTPLRKRIELIAKKCTAPTV